MRHPGELPGRDQGGQGHRLQGHHARPGRVHRRGRAIGQHLWRTALRVRQPPRHEPDPVRAHQQPGHCDQGPAAGSRRQTNGVLRIGALLPHTGDLASAGPPMFAGAQLAVREINAAGGVLDRQVVWVDGDDFTDKAKAVETAQRLINQEGVQVIIGPAPRRSPRRCCRPCSAPGWCCSRRATRPPSSARSTTRASTSGPRPGQPAGRGADRHHHARRLPAGRDHRARRRVAASWTRCRRTSSRPACPPTRWPRAQDPESRTSPASVPR